MHNLSKELTEEKLKVKSLSEEIENPINVHRWRKLEATDSETYELMTTYFLRLKRTIKKEKNPKELMDIIIPSNMTELSFSYKFRNIVKNTIWLIIHSYSFKLGSVWPNLYPFSIFLIIFSTS